MTVNNAVAVSIASTIEKYSAGETAKENDGGTYKSRGWLLSKYLARAGSEGEVLKQNSMSELLK